MFGDALPLEGGEWSDTEDLLSLFFQNRRRDFTLTMEELDEGCLTALAASSEVTESNENLLEGVCDGGRPSSIIAIGTPSPDLIDIAESLALPVLTLVA